MEDMNPSPHSVKILVTGSRSWNDIRYLEDVFRNWDIKLGSNVKKVLISGNCPTGADMLAEIAVTKLGWEVRTYPAEWDKYGTAAGFIRNKEMVDLDPDYVISFIKDGSPGATGTVKLARKKNLYIEQHLSDSGNPIKVITEEPRSVDTEVDESDSNYLW